MENNKRMYSKNKIAVVALIAIIAAFVAAIFFGQGAVYAHASDAVVGGVEEKTFSSATIDEDFVDDTIVVVLNQQESLRFSRYSAANFPELQIESIDEINKNATRIVQNQISDERAGNPKARNRIVDNDTYRKVIAIRLQEKGKENVLSAIRLLEQRDDVISATPDYIFSFRGLPNDQSFTSSSFINTNGTQWGINGATWNIGASAA